MKEALCFWQSTPIATLPFDKAVFCRVVKDYGFAQFNYKFFVGCVVLLLNKMFNLIKKNIFVYAHKEALQVEFQDVAIFCVICRALPYKPVNPLNAKMSAFANSATVTIVYKLFFKQMV